MVCFFLKKIYIAYYWVSQKSTICWLFEPCFKLCLYIRLIQGPYTMKSGFDQVWILIALIMSFVYVSSRWFHLRCLNAYHNCWLTPKMLRDARNNVEAEQRCIMGDFACQWLRNGIAHQQPLWSFGAFYILAWGDHMVHKLDKSTSLQIDTSKVLR